MSVSVLVFFKILFGIHPNTRYGDWVAAFRKTEEVLVQLSWVLKEVN